MINFRISAAEWSKDQSALQQLRSEVFIKEQKVPPELEWEEQDADANHWLALLDDKPIGCCRMLRDGHIGRMAVLAEYRKQGAGMALLEAALSHARKLNLLDVYLYAQTQAINFYQKAGFIASGEEFLDANIPHRTMRLQLQARRLGQHSGHFAVENYQHSCADLIAQSEQQLCILSQFLDHRIFDSAEVAESISDLARKSRYTEVLILILDSKKIVERGHRLLELHRRLPSKVLLRKTHALPSDVKDNLIIADRCGLIVQSIKEPEKIWGDYNNQPVAKTRLDNFYHWWNKATADNNLRRLDL